MPSGAALGTLLVLIAVIYEYSKPIEKVLEVGKAWDSILSRNRIWPRKIAVGVNANLDLIVSATSLLRAVEVPPREPSDHEVLETLEDISELVSYSMQGCAGIERHFRNQSIFESIVKAAQTIPHTYYIGGNAALMAQKLTQIVPNAEIMLVAPVGPRLKSLLHSKVLISLESPSIKDEVHVIMEYPSNEQWGTITSMCANRVIYSHDLFNSQLSFLEPFGAAIATFSPDLVILSGAHLLEGTGQSFWQKRVQEIAIFLDAVKVPVHFELATVGDLTFLKSILDGVLRKVSSLGLNEQELISLSKAAGVRLEHSLSKPDVAMVSDLLHTLVTTVGSMSRLSRIHLHTLTYHIVAEVTGGHWSGGQAAVASGARTAGLQACDLLNFEEGFFEIQLPQNISVSYQDPVLSKQVMTFSATSPLFQWHRSGVQYYLSPVLVCKKPLRTVGLGDAISSAGLIYSEYNF